MLQQGLQCVYVQRFDEAIALFKQCRQVNLTDPTPAYNLACCYSLKRDIDSGIRWLTVAVDLGLDYEDLQQDPDLENMFEDPRFQSIWDRMRNLSADELAQVDAGKPLSEVRPANSLTNALTQQYPQVLQNDASRSSPRLDSAGSVEGPDAVFESRLQDGVEAVARGDTQEAVRCFESCLRLRPEDAACAYNLTCCHALMGAVDQAVTWFGNAVKWGLAEVAGLDPARDPDLSSLMSNAQFQELLQELKQRQRQIESAGGSPDGAPAASLDSFAPQTSDANLNSSLGAQSWAAADTSSSTVQHPDSRSFASAPVGYDQRPRPSPEGAPPFGHETAPAWGPYGLEQHPQDVLGNRGVSQQMPGMRSVPERTSSLRRWQAATHQLPHDPEEWALVHVAHWLKQLGLGKYVEKFEEQDIRGDVLLDLTSTECEQVLGIRVLGHRKLLMKSLEYLRKQSKMDRDAFLAELQG
jgi:tetratricopeptide (TPR) repeat protein